MKDGWKVNVEDTRKRPKSVIRRVQRILGPLKGFRYLVKLVEADELARRYFVMNAFDGALAILGIIVGSIIAGEANPKVIISAGIGASLAMGISGAWGAYVSERAERKRAIKELENHLFRDLKGSLMDRASQAAVLWVAFIDGLSPVLAAAIPLIPLVMVHIQLVPFAIGLGASITLNLVTLFTLGVFLGKISKENIWLHGILMVVVGVITAFLLLGFLRF